MRGRLPVLFLAGFVFLFWIFHKGAYQGYFQDDDLDNLALSRDLPLKDFLVPFVIPRVFEHNFRPAGGLYYKAIDQFAGTGYVPYVAGIQLIHLANVILLWFVLRRLGLGEWATGVGCLFWGIHMAAFDVFWKPMYVFDLLCGLFCLLSMLAYLHGRWVLAFIAMWVAYRSKEMAIMLPVVFLAYEWWVGSRRWKQLGLFFGLSLVLGVQALFHNGNEAENAYTLHLTPTAIWTCARYYSGRILLIPLVGFAIPALALVPDKRVRWGVAMFGALLFPMLLLPGRLFSAYLYVPMIGLALVAAALASRAPRAAFVALAVFWIPWNFVQMKRQRNVALADVRDRKAFVGKVFDFSRANPDITNFLGGPGPVNTYGTLGAVRLAHPVGTRLAFEMADTAEGRALAKQLPLAILNWDGQKHALGVLARRADTADTSYINMGVETPVWQLEEGWFDADGAYRWMSGRAKARLTRPAGARTFELTVNAGDLLIAVVKRSVVSVWVNGVELGSHGFTQPGYRTARWDLPAGPAGPAAVEFRVSPTYRDATRELGIAVVGFGFVSE